MSQYQGEQDKRPRCLSSTFERTKKSGGKAPLFLETIEEQIRVLETVIQEQDMELERLKQGR